MAGIELTARCHRRGLDVSLTVAPGEVVALLGPNGAGKSTVLQAIAGLVDLDAGGIRIGDRVVTRTPPHRRRVGLLAQDPLLFPHLSVAANIAFGPRSAGKSRRVAAVTARRWLAEVDGVELARRRPGQLSGGQAQRVAVARALAAEPDVLLLDEPMAALDAQAVVAMRALLRRVLVQRTGIVVTHNLIDAVTLADRVVVLEGGRVVESGPVGAVLARPRSAFVAAMAGLNVLTGTATESGLEGMFPITGVRDGDCAPGSPAVAVFSPVAVAIYRDMPSVGSPRNVLQVTIRQLEDRGPLVRVCSNLDSVVADITVQAVAELGLAVGDDVWFVVKAAEVAIYAVAG